MPTISNHHDETYLILREFNIEEDIAYKIAHFASLYADNPDNPKSVTIPVIGVKVGFQPTVAGNNVLHKIVTLTNGSSLSYYCIKPATFYCSSEDRRAVNYTSTKNSQNSFDSKETVRHSMLSKNDLFGGIESSIKYGMKEDYEEGVNKINLDYGFNVKNRFLVSDDFIAKYKYLAEQMVYQSYQSQDIIYLGIKRKYLQYVASVNSRIREMEGIAKKRGIRFGWEKVFLAADESKKSNFTSWEVDSSDDKGVSGLALLGVGLHAIQDAYIHNGENMEHFDEHTLTHIIKDTFIRDKLRDITRKIIMVFLIMSDNYSFLKPSQIKGLIVNELGLIDFQQTQINNSIIYYNAIYLPNKKGGTGGSW